MSQIPPYSIELLAPARDAEVAIAAITHGADAVYIGAPHHGARAAASNSVSDIARVCDFAHRYRAAVYVTLNTIIYESELKDVERLIRDLYRAGADALIVQDLGILRLDIPPIALHASTQCDIRSAARARFLQQLGFSQLVLPRELTLEEIREMRSAVSVPLEAFVHGALCVSYSGDCRASLMCGGRSANRGECAQICRLPFDLTDGNGRQRVTGRHLLSLRDLNRIGSLKELIDAGVSSLKIEGRLKSADYVKNVVGAYDVALRAMGVSRTSDGIVERRFTPDAGRSFSRGFTDYFLYETRPASLTTADSPKSLGPEVAVVKAVRGNRIEVTTQADIANGDGLSYIDHATGEATGFRVNRMASREVILTAREVLGLQRGTILRRNYDKAFTDMVNAPDSAIRYIPLDMSLRRAGSRLILETNGTAVCLETGEMTAARTDQSETRRRVLGKLGNTVYRLGKITDLTAEEFIPASTLGILRNRLTDALDTAMKVKGMRRLRRPEQSDATWPEGTALTYHNNVANSMAADVYATHGVTGRIEPAAETQKPAADDENPMTIMTTRHCIRRELGHCLLTPRGRDWPEPLSIKSELIGTLRLQFDCKACRMNVLKGS